MTTSYTQGWLTGVSTSAGATALLANASYADPFGGPTGQLSGADLGTGGTYHFSAT